MTSILPLYREYPPSASLQPWIDCFWSRHATSLQQQSHRVLPDGCIDILFELEVASAGTGYINSSYVVGMMTRPIIIARSGPSDIFAVRFKPGAAAAFIREPLHRLTDSRADLGDLWPHSHDLRMRIASAQSTAERIALVERELLTRVLPQRPVLSSPAVALRSLSRQPDFRIERLCRDLSITRQGLAKAFRNQVGISPKSLSRILRMQKVVRHIDHCPPKTAIVWSDLAQTAGYFDQSHMIREIRELCGLSPLALLHERRPPVSISPRH